MTRPSPPPAARLTLGALLLLATCASCRVMGATTANLDALHNTDSTHKRNAALVYHWEYVIRRMLGQALEDPESADYVETKSTKNYKAPHKHCLEYLIELGKYSPKTLENSGRQIEWFARLAVDDPWRLCRERALLELGPAGARLEIDKPVGLGNEEPASADEVREVVARMTRSIQPIVTSSSPTDAEVQSFVDACAAMEALVLDLEGARRALRVLTDLYEFGGLGEREKQALEAASLHVQQSAVRQALAAGLRDPEGMVRAAAVEASVRATGRAVLDALILQLRPEEAEVVLLRVLDLVREFGLPREDEVGGNDWFDVRHDWYRAVYRLAVFHPSGMVRTSAMRTLQVITAGPGFEDGAVDSLREEDWQIWWRSYTAERRLQKNAADE